MVRETPPPFMANAILNSIFYFEPFPSAMLVLYLNVNIVIKGFTEGVVHQSPHIIDNAHVQRIQEGI